MLKPFDQAMIEFQLHERIGDEGKNSEVFKATDPQLNAELAIKKVSKTKFRDVTEYFNEATLLYLSRHSSVLPIHYACQDNDHIYLAMPLCTKGSLKGLLASRFLSVREIITFATQFLSGLHHIHSQRLLHLDIKPDNILITERGEAVLSDFGLTKQMNFDGVAGQDRLYGKMIAPEAFQTDQLTISFDIYQAGLTMYRMCVGDAEFYSQFSQFGPINAFDRDAFKFAVRNERFPNRKEYPEHIPKKLIKTITKCLRSDPAQRFQSVLEVINGFADVVGNELDWFYSNIDGIKQWVKTIDDRQIFLIIDLNNNAEAFSLSNNDTKRRIKEYCTSNITSDQIQKFLTEN